MAGNGRQGSGILECTPVNEPVSIAELNVLASLRLISALARSGVRDFVVSSGSRCTPLVLGVAHGSDVRVLANPDERSAGFMALGIAKASGRPAGLICTSGTAAANYLPSVIEARMSCTPLVILTADRPPELRGTGAPQTIDQLALYGRYTCYFADLTAPGADGFDVKDWETQALEAVSAAQGPAPGPVHLNIPFREPLIPNPTAFARTLAAHSEGEKTRRAQRHDTHQSEQRMSPVASGTWDSIALRLTSVKPGLIICGPQTSDDAFGAAVSRLAARIGFPILTDIASQVRFGPHHSQRVLSHFDLCLRENRFADTMRPEVVLRLGGLPTSRILNDWLAAVPRHEHIIISPHIDIADPDRLGTTRIVAGLEEACREISARIGEKESTPDRYLLRWQDAEREIVSQLSERIDVKREVFEGDVVASVFRLAPKGAAIFLSNSMPIRWAEFYATGDATRYRVFCNRGANGIDGIVSTAAGVASVTQQPTALVIGDIAALHDLSGLQALRQNNIPLKIVLLNNDGGGIFSFLPVSEHTTIFERLVAMPHGRDFSQAAAFAGIAHQCLQSLADFNDAFSSCLRRAEPQILEIKFDRGHSLKVSREVNRRIAVRIASLS